MLLINDNYWILDAAGELAIFRKYQHYSSFDHDPPRIIPNRAHRGGYYLLTTNADNIAGRQYYINNYQNKPEIVQIGKSVIDIACTNFSYLLLVKNDENTVLHEIDFSRRTHPGRISFYDVSVPVEINTRANITTISCGHQHALLLDELGNIYGHGSGDNGALYLNLSWVPEFIFLRSNISHIMCSNNLTTLVTADNILYLCGVTKTSTNISNDIQEELSGTDVGIHNDVDIIVPNYNIEHVVHSKTHIIVLFSNHDVVCYTTNALTEMLTSTAEIIIKTVERWAQRKYLHIYADNDIIIGLDHEYNIYLCNYHRTGITVSLHHRSLFTNENEADVIMPSIGSRPITSRRLIKSAR